MALLAAWLLPFASRSPLVSVQTCAFKGATGLPCALCGGSRATQAALRGDFARACYLNMAALPSIAIVASVDAVVVVRGHRWKCSDRLGEVSANGFDRFCRFCWRSSAFTGSFILPMPSALPKPELIDLRNPIARFICQRFLDSEQ